jgi:hypothetical protein
MPDFMPHGYRNQWNPPVLWLHVISDDAGLTASGARFTESESQRTNHSS